MGTILVSRKTALPMLWESGGGRGQRCRLTLGMQMRAFAASIVCLVAFLVPAGPLLAEPLPRSILVFVQSDPRGPFHAELFGALRSVIDNEAREPVSIYLEYLDRSRFTAPAYQEEQRRY